MHYNYSLSYVWRRFSLSTLSNSIYIWTELRNANKCLIMACWNVIIVTNFLNQIKTLQSLFLLKKVFDPSCLIRICTTEPVTIHHYLSQTELIPYAGSTNCRCKHYKSMNCMRQHICHRQRVGWFWIRRLPFSSRSAEAANWIWLYMQISEQLKMLYVSLPNLLTHSKIACLVHHK